MATGQLVIKQNNIRSERNKFKVIIQPNRVSVKKISFITRIIELRMFTL